jgi:hypothetical protein
MDKKSLRLILGICVCLILFAAAGVKAEEVSVAQVSSELQQSGTVTADEAKALEPSIKAMVDAGETKADIKNAVAQATAAARAQGLKGKDLAAKVHAAVQERKRVRTETKAQTKAEVKNKVQNKKTSGAAASKGKGSRGGKKGKK